MKSEAEHNGYYFVRLKGIRNAWRIGKYDKDLHSFTLTGISQTIDADDLEVDHQTGLILRKNGEQTRISNK